MLSVARQFETARVILERNNKLRREIETVKEEITDDDGDIKLVWKPDLARIKRVIVKNARGHAFYELGRPMFGEPVEVFVDVLEYVEENRLATFLQVDPGHGWPEVGSRMLQRVIAGADIIHGWVIVQPEVYVFAVIDNGLVTVRSIIREYLLTEVSWSI
jgi:hypothetical protein